MAKPMFPWLLINGNQCATPVNKLSVKENYPITPMHAWLPYCPCPITYDSKPIINTGNTQTHTTHTKQHNTHYTCSNLERSLSLSISSLVGSNWSSPIASLASSSEEIPPPPPNAPDPNDPSMLDSIAGSLGVPLLPALQRSLNWDIILTLSNDLTPPLPPNLCLLLSILERRFDC